MNKEQAYDDRISPLLHSIIEICKEHGIAMIASFHIPTPEDDGLCCTSMLPDGEGGSGPHHMRAFRVLRGDGDAVAMTVTRRVPGLTP